MTRPRATPTPRLARPTLRGVVIALGLLIATAGNTQQTRIGYVDMKRLLDNAPQMAVGNERLRAEFSGRDRLLKADETRLEDLRARQRRDPAAAQTAAGQALAAEIEALERKVRRTRDTLREELRRRSDEETDLSWRAINEAVATYAREQAYDLIVSSPVFYASPSIDITDNVLARLREQQAADARDAD